MSLDRLSSTASASKRYNFGQDKCVLAWLRFVISRLVTSLYEGMERLLYCDWKEVLKVGLMKGFSSTHSGRLEGSRCRNLFVTE